MAENAVEPQQESIAVSYFVVAVDTQQNFSTIHGSAAVNLNGRWWTSNVKFAANVLKSIFVNEINLTYKVSNIY